MLHFLTDLIISQVSQSSQERNYFAMCERSQVCPEGHRAEQAIMSRLDHYRRRPRTSCFRTARLRSAVAWQPGKAKPSRDEACRTLTAVRQLPRNNLE